MKQIQDIEPILYFPVFEEGDIVHLDCGENESLEVKVLDCSYFDYFHDGSGMGVTYCVKLSDGAIHNVWGFLIIELKERGD